MIKRRSLLAAAGAAVGAAAVTASGLLGLAYARSTQEETIAAIVYKRLAYLKLDAAGVQQFARDFAARRLLSGARLRLVGMLWPLYRRLPLDQSGARLGAILYDRVDHAEERIVSTYLISSDFFLHGADQSRVVCYRGCYDALTHACGNPFCRPAEV
jgi:hypothetical protein